MVNKDTAVEETFGLTVGSFTTQALLPGIGQDIDLAPPAVATDHVKPRARLLEQELAPKTKTNSRDFERPSGFLRDVHGERGRRGVTNSEACPVVRNPITVGDLCMRRE